MTEGNDGYFNKEVVGGEGRGDGDFVDGIGFIELAPSSVWDWMDLGYKVPYGLLLPTFLRGGP
jgi:hypothetical protein